MIPFLKLQKVTPRNVCLRTSATAFMEFLAINIKSFDGEPENWHIFIDSFECAMDKKMTLHLPFKK